jgi:uncharacterized membrane protein YccC
LRTTAAGLLALYVALALGLDQPQWAIMTVFIIAQPFTGMVLAKGIYRVIGTAVGVLAGTGLASLLQDRPTGFVVAMALWLSVCTFVSGLLRDNRSYGAVLAGYTAGVVAYPAYGSHELVAELASARFIEILVGLLCGGAVSALLLPRSIRPELYARLGACLTDMGHYVGGALRGHDPAAVDAMHRKLIADTHALDTLRAYAVIEAPVLHLRNRMVRRLIGSVLSAMTSARTIQIHVRPEDTPLRPLLLQVAAAFEKIANAPNGIDRSGIEALGAAESRIAARQAELVGGSDEDVAAAALLAALAELVHAAIQATTDYSAFMAGRSDPKEHGSRAKAPLAVHRSPALAFRNGLRTFIAVTVLGVLWQVSGWTEGAGVVAIAAAIISLFGTRINALELSQMFLRGTACALPVAFATGHLLLPHLPGFGWTAAVVTPILVLAGLAMARPTMTVTATGFAVMYLALLNPRPHMTYDPAGFAMLAAAVIIGLVICILVFKLVLPPSPRAEAHQLLDAIRNDLARLCIDDAPPRLVFESRMYDRINQLLPRLDALASPPDEMLDGSLAALTLGLQILQLRSQEAGRPPGGVLDDLLRRLAGLLSAPGHGEAMIDLVAELGRAAGTIARIPAAAGPSCRPAVPERLRDAAALRLMAAALADHAGFFAPG